ncbi:unnamed protein product [Chondrus crispus]|uniref:Sulfotransferase domain-containing protein n=1 Tax=Chondrus crispus TaxID=2769 RepID=R7Q6E3_CHOCR|nr:unnamed protein product [Chondrus crispus]CDF33015.1 unnamed protein product [Chondrus crispus]|eukprot:XP_005712818.1 unnamed protein product [Chondrus crispus]
MQEVRAFSKTVVDKEPRDEAPPQQVERPVAAPVAAPVMAPEAETAQRRVTLQMITEEAEREARRLMREEEGGQEGGDVTNVTGEASMGDVEGVVKEEVKEEPKEEVREEIREDVTVNEEVINEVKEEVKNEVKDEVKEEFRTEVRAEVQEEVQEEVKAEINEEIKEEVNTEVEEVTTQGSADVSAEVRESDHTRNETSEVEGESAKPVEVNPESDAVLEERKEEGMQAEKPVEAVERKSADASTGAGVEPVDGSSAACLRHIVYDKPVKTGSTAVTKALKKYLNVRGAQYLKCTFQNCTEAAREVCAGEREKVNFVEHLTGDADTMGCLGRSGYYRVTSIREPLERWESAFLYNRGKKATHYGIHYEASYEEFMSKYPACSLFDYYDGLGKRCEVSTLPLEERIARIVERYDEVMDLYQDEVLGQLHRRLEDDLREENKSSRPPHDFRVPIDLGRLQNETRLYEALRQRQKELVGKERRLC